MAKIIISDPNFAALTKSMEILREQGHAPFRTPFPVSEEQLVSYLPDVEAIVSGPDPIGRRALKAAPKLKLIARFGVGVDNIDVAEATKRRVIVTNAPGCNADAVADYVFCLMLALSRNICTAARLVPGNRWQSFRGSEVWGKTLGVLGTGQIGSRVIFRATGFGMKVLAYDSNPDKTLVDKHGVLYNGLDELLERCDYVTVHVPRVPETAGLIGKEELGRMKPTAYLINTSRGGIVDESALLEALKDKGIAGAALDVFAEEPPQPSPLFDLPNVIVTPHIASSTNEAIRNVDHNCLQNVLHVLSGREPLSAINHPFED